VHQTLLASASVAACLSAAVALGPGAPAVATVHQRATLTVSPGIAQNSGSPASPDAAALLGVATFSPARRGRVVVVQRRVSGEAWRTVVRTREDARGQVRFVRDDKRGVRPYTYRAFAAARRGLPRVTTNSESSAAWRLRFEDRFGGTSLDLRKWGYRSLGLRRGSRLHAQSDRSAVRVGGGALSLQVRKNPANPARYYYNGHIGTSRKFSFRYGYAAARIRFARGRGQHGAFWMQPQSPLAPYGSPARTGTEIDVAEFFGQGYPRGGMASFVYSYPSRTKLVKSGAVLPAAARALRGRGDAWWSRYHVFSVHWTSRGHVFRIDGIETSRVMTAVSRRPEYLLLSLLSSDWELPRLDTATLPTTMKVDWVRVWQR
jgi:beta-glucanase (GH16 family)